MSEKIPVTVLTGFLGSGKTTLLNRILSEDHGQRIAVIENEFGEIGIDQDLVINADEEFFEMNNGCICCTVRGDLIRILNELLERKEKIDRVILETTGMADPGPVAQTFFVDADIKAHYELDGIITLVDAKHVRQHLENKTDEVLAQIAFADRIILNKIDLVTKKDLALLQRQLQEMNKMAGFYSATMASAPISEMLDIGGFNIQRATQIKPNFLEPEYPFEWGGIWQLPAGHYRFQLQNGPDPDMTLLYKDVELASEASLQTTAEAVFIEFSDPVESLVTGSELALDGKCYRLLLEGEDSYEYEFNLAEPTHIAVYSQHTPEEFGLKLLDVHKVEQDPVAEHYFNAEHEHDQEVTSVAIELPGLLHEGKTELWFQMFLQEKGVDVYRMKGVLALRGETQRILFQGVHMMFDSQLGEPWADEPPVSRIVFIGKNLDEEYISIALESCLYRDKSKK